MNFKGLKIADGAMKIFDGTRTTFTTDGTLVNLLPESYDLNLSDINLNFPDFTKSDAYYWSGGHTVVIGGTDRRSEGCSTSITVIPQNWNNFSSPVILGASPSSLIDFIDILVYPRRINTPSNWMGAAIPIPIAQNQWTDMGGGSSVLLEQALGMSRSASCVLQDGNVVLLGQQSVANAPTGYTTNPATNTGVTYGPNGQGIPVSARDFKEYINITDIFLKYVYRRNEDFPCVFTDNTNYASQWRFDFKIAFGRRT